LNLDPTKPVESPYYNQQIYAKGKGKGITLT